MARKRSLENTSRKSITEAAQLNIRVLKKLEKALASNPEVNLLSLFPSTYSTRLENRMKITDQDGMSKCVVSNDSSFLKLFGLLGMPSLKNDLQTQDDYKPPTPRDDVRHFLSFHDVAIIDRLADSTRISQEQNDFDKYIYDYRKRSTILYGSHCTHSRWRSC